MTKIGYSTSVFWEIAGLAMVVGNLIWPLFVGALAAIVAIRKKHLPSYIALGGASLALFGHIVRMSGVTVHSSAANIPLPLLNQNYLVYFLFFHAIPIGMAVFSAAFLYAIIKRRI